MKYYLRKALLTIIWLLCSFQVAQLWLDPNIMARSSLVELALISIVMVVIASSHIHREAFACVKIGKYLRHALWDFQLAVRSWRIQWAHDFCLLSCRPDF